MSKVRKGGIGPDRANPVGILAHQSWVSERLEALEYLVRTQSLPIQSREIWLRDRVTALREASERRGFAGLPTDDDMRRELLWLTLELESETNK